MNVIRVCISWVIVLVLMAFAFFRRKKIRVWPSILLTISVTFFSLLSPIGKVLLLIGRFRITQGALLNGLQKSAFLVGMVFLSQTIVSYRITLPSIIGTYFNQIFVYFDRLTAQRISFKKGNIIAQIDDILLTAWNTCYTTECSSEKTN